MQIPVLSALLPSGCLGTSTARVSASCGGGTWLLQDAPQLENPPLGASQCLSVHHQPGVGAGSLVPNYRTEDLNLENLPHLHMRCI